MLAQLAMVVEYTNCMSAKGQDFPNECSGYDTIQSDGEASVMLEFWVLNNFQWLICHKTKSNLIYLIYIYV